MEKEHMPSNKIQTPTRSVRLTGGIIAHRDYLNTTNLLKQIDPYQFAAIFEDEHDSWFAEPEFAGQYVDACVQHYRRSGEQSFLDTARIVVDSIQKNQRADGYLGTYREGLEFDETFSVWNQAFAIKGLVSYYEVTGSEAALTAATRSADYVANHYLAPDGPDILRSINQCIQHTSMLQQIARLYRMTGRQLYLDFAEFIVGRWEETTIKFVTAPNEWSAPLFEMGALKAIESLVCFQGIVELYEATGELRYLSAAKRYWQLVNNEQINIIGCGSLTELWVYHGKRPANLPIDVRPNETCVAWGWGRLSMMLFQLTGDAKYVDAIEKTLYNHILGAQAADGSDFSYYQGLIGCKVHARTPGQYSCCRYRGLHFLSYLADYVVTYDSDHLYINLFTPAEARVFDDGGDGSSGGGGAPPGGATGIASESGAATVKIDTEYPRSGTVRVSLDLPNEREFSLCLRIPEWCASYLVRLDGEPVEVAAEGVPVRGAEHGVSRPEAASEAPDAGPGSASLQKGYVVVPGRWAAGTHEIELELDMTVRAHRANVDHRHSAAVTYGPLALAIDSRYGTPIHDTEISLDGDRSHERSGNAQSQGDDGVALEPMELDAEVHLPIVKFRLPGRIRGMEQPVTLVDYASAGSTEPNHDEFKVWIPISDGSHGDREHRERGNRQ